MMVRSYMSVLILLFILGFLDFLIIILDFILILNLQMFSSSDRVFSVLFIKILHACKP
jgi:hypothetical protein